MLINNKAIVAAGLPHKTPYIVRHTFAAWALTIRTDPNLLVNLMGHASKQMVYETYGNYVEGLEHDADKIYNYFGADFLNAKPQNLISFPRIERCEQETVIEVKAA